MSSFEYALVRVVPRVEREEFLNAGVILFCLAQRFLCARVHVDEQRLRSLWPDLDVELVRVHLNAFHKISQGDPEAGPVGCLSQRERFRWLVSPRSTIIQISPVHSGLCEDPRAEIERLFQKFVLIDVSNGENR